MALRRLNIHLRRLGQREVSVATVLQRAENVLPCYNIVEHQIRPQIEQKNERCAQSASFTHTLRWSWDGKEFAIQGTHRTKRGAKNEAARQLLQHLAREEAELLDPRQNGAVAQWVIGNITEKLDASLDVKEEAPEPDEANPHPEKSHVCTWTCSQIQGEVVGTGSARAAADSRRQAFMALYQNLPSAVEEAILKVEAEASQPSASVKAKSATDRQRMGEINALHNNVVQKLNIRAKWDTEKSSEGFVCKLTWNFFDQEGGRMCTEEVTATASSKMMAKTLANEQMLRQQKQMPLISDSDRGTMEEIKQALREQRVQEACMKAQDLMEAADSSTWSFFLPQLLRAVLGEGDRQQMQDLLDCTQRLSEQQGLPLDVWEALLDEASFAIRHYFMALPALRQLAGFSLADAFPSDLEKEYFRRFRHLLALERHGSLMAGIQTYELDPSTAWGVPTVEIHFCEADRVSLTSSPGRNINELVEGARPLRPTDLALMVPSEYAEETPSPEEGNSISWQHPEAWLGSVTSVAGNPRMGEEVKIQVRRISDFASDVELQESGAGPRPSPITIGREFRLFFLAMETPLSRELEALRNLTKVKLPVWSENFESKPSYQYLEGIQQMLVSGPEEALRLAMEPARGGLSPELARSNMETLARQHALIASLTPSQSGAVEKALGQRLSVVQGPPGTGKTHVAVAILAAWANIFGPMGERILAVADSNVAADNMFVRLQQMGVEATRVGQGKEVEGMSGEVMWREVQRAKIVVATCIGSGMEILNSKASGGFQRVLVDECTQACEPAVLVPLGRQAEQVVLIGDHAQLPATVLSKAAQNEGLGVSLFERMVRHNGLEPTMLLEQRRMHSSIADFPNQTFYSGQLINAAEDSALPAVPGFPWPNPDCRVAFVDVSSDSLEGRRGFSAFNTGEAEALAGVLEEILGAGYPPNQIAVLTAYLAQKQELMRAIRDRGLGSYLSSISVDTIDGYQGMEQGLILFSATRSNESRALGFLADNRRMNVMLTRAKQGLIVFGNADTLRNSVAPESRWPDWLAWAEERKAVLGAHEVAERMQSTSSSPSRSLPAARESAALGGNPFEDLHSTSTGSGTRESASTAQPSQSSQSSQSQPSPGDPSPPPLPPLPPPTPPPTVWQQVYSSEYKAYYYWNKETNVTQWEEPPSFAPASSM
ncbi:unnamed protein product [Effrenium voratum]|uniref:WW domain-containing protein n=1 Tax=Effrenium voratum TaxID=2562239 RepID=A0AA36IC10_9DINO|nr:unnamed protein product [Effrenium voratum]CAJ1445152.1 unnamed protein product [Effrenium voratum]